MSDFGKILKSKRELAGLGQAEVASYIGKTTRMYQRYEGGTIPDAKVRQKLQELLKYDINATIEGKGGGSLSVGDMAAKLIRIEAQQSVILGTQAEILAHLTDKSVPAVLRQKANEVKTMEEELRSELGE